jgi:hypothetical protein
MQTAARKFLLHCDHAKSRFTLARERENWQRSFDRFEEAFEEAEARATERTSLILYDEAGAARLRLLVSPAPLERKTPLAGQRLTAAFVD